MSEVDLGAQLDVRYIAPTQHLDTDALLTSTRKAIRGNVHERMYESETQPHRKVQLCVGAHSL